MSRRLPFGAPIATVAQMRAAEQVVIDGGVSADELMERAGLAVAREVRRLGVGRPVLVAAGPGKNGGDAYVAARHLHDWGLDVVVTALGRPEHGAAARMAARWTGRVVPIEQAEPRAVFVDGLFGTGANRPFERKQALLLDEPRGKAALSIAIDVPSGIDADGVTARNPLLAHVTVALGALKPAHVVGPDAGCCGHVILADIGVPVRTGSATIAPPLLESLKGDVQKFSRGMVAIVGGAMPGASLLAATAAMHGGAGYVVLAERGAGGDLPHALVRRSASDPDALTRLLEDDRIGAVVVGPGLGRDRQAEGMLDVALASRRDLVIDADALSLLGTDVARRIESHRRRVFLTPHGGEFDRLFGAGSGNKIDRTVAAASKTGAIVVHKGGDTVVATPDGEAVVLASATPWLSTAGTGDVLAGLLAARHVRHRGDPFKAASEAIWLHAAAAARATPPFIADDVVDCLPAAMAAQAWI